METPTKEQIVGQMGKFAAKVGSQNKAALMLKISPATFSQMMTGKHDLISDEMWRSVWKQISADEWISVDTRQSQLLFGLFNDARDYSNVYGVCSDAGSGKTHTAKLFAAQNENTYLVCCNEYFNRISFLKELLRAMGKDSGGYDTSDMVATVVDILLRADRPLIVLDEADKLSDQVMALFISLYNMAENRAGIIMMATNHLEQRIERGLRLNKKGFKEIFSRLGRKFVHLPAVGKRDVVAVAKANGIKEEESLNSIWNQSECDMRRVKRLVHSVKMQAE